VKTKTWILITNTGKQADLESGLEKKEVQKPTYISARDFIHWLAAESRIDGSLRSLLRCKSNSLLTAFRCFRSHLLRNLAKLSPVCVSGRRCELGFQVFQTPPKSACRKFREIGVGKCPSTRPESWV
jgi:hypothetical protein